LSTCSKQSGVDSRFENQYSLKTLEKVVSTIKRGVFLSEPEFLSKPEFSELQNCRISCVTLTNLEFERISELARFHAKA
jgi:hypothetical protein